MKNSLKNRFGCDAVLCGWLSMGCRAENNGNLLESPRHQPVRTNNPARIPTTLRHSRDPTDRYDVSVVARVPLEGFPLLRTGVAHAAAQRPECKRTRRRGDAPRACALLPLRAHRYGGIKNKIKNKKGLDDTNVDVTLEAREDYEDNAV